ncbi:hypothetical protein ACP4OV_030876 [Aristida adscensionis]
MKIGVLLGSEISLTRLASPPCSFFFFFFFPHIFFVPLFFSGSGVVVGFVLFFFDSNVKGSSASLTFPPQMPRILFFFLFVSDVDVSFVASLDPLPQTPRIHEQQHAHLRRLQLRRFLQPHLLAELSNPIELMDRRESERAPSCRSLHAQTKNSKRLQRQGLLMPTCMSMHLIC